MINRAQILGRALRPVYERLRLQHAWSRVRGHGNRLVADGAVLRDVRFDITGDGNTIIVHPGSRLHRVRFVIRGNRQHVEIGANCEFIRGGEIWMEDDDGRLTIGEGTTIEDAHLALTEARGSIAIGRDCMFANGIDVRNGDSHGIYSATDGQRLNPARDVTIGDHVWIAAHAIVLKGVSIPNGCVVATGAVVASSITEPNSILAGNPARIVQRDITWTRGRGLV